MNTVGLRVPNIDEFLGELVAKATAATPGPWQATGSTSVRAADDEMIATCTSYLRRVADHEFIAAASPDVVLALINRVRAAERERDAAVESTRVAVGAWLSAHGDRCRYYKLANAAMIFGLDECTRLRGLIRTINTVAWDANIRNSHNACREIHELISAALGDGGENL